VVAIIDQRASSISVLGDVGTPSRFPANANGERLLDSPSAQTPEGREIVEALEAVHSIRRRAVRMTALEE
jgi:protein involved in polysaccharide export with SLBB domain